MDKTKILLLLSVALTVTACGSSNSNRDDSLGLGNTTPANNEASYLGYIKKLIAEKTSDDTEPLDVEMVTVEKSDDTEAVDVM